MPDIVDGTEFVAGASLSGRQVSQTLRADAGASGRPNRLMRPERNGRPGPARRGVGQARGWDDVLEPSKRRVARRDEITDVVQ